MKASPGDRLVIRGHAVGEHVHDGEILDVLGEGGEPPYVVRWSDDGHVTRIFPGSDAYVEHYARRQRRHSWSSVEIGRTRKGGVSR